LGGPPALAMATREVPEVERDRGGGERERELDLKFWREFRSAEKNPRWRRRCDGKRTQTRPY
jgi:hypothetical protein